MDLSPLMCAICWENFSTTSGSRNHQCGCAGSLLHWQPTTYPAMWSHHVCGLCVWSATEQRAPFLQSRGVWTPPPPSCVFGSCPWCRTLVNLRNLPVNISLVQILNAQDPTPTSAQLRQSGGESQTTTDLLEVQLSSLSNLGFPPPGSECVRDEQRGGGWFSGGMPSRGGRCGMRVCCGEGGGRQGL